MLRSLIKNERGQNMIEMALVLPILLLLLFGIIEFGRIFYSFLSINNGARAGARYAAVHVVDDDDLKDIIAEKSFPGDSDAQDTVVAHTTIEYVDSDGDEDRESDGTVEISIAYPVELYAPLIYRIIGDVDAQGHKIDQKTVTAAVIMRVE